MITRSYRPEFLINGHWYANAQRFATKDEADRAAWARFCVWTEPTEYRAAPSPDFPNQGAHAETLRKAV